MGQFLFFTILVSRLIRDMRAEVTDLEYVRQIDSSNQIMTVLAPGQSFKKSKKTAKRSTVETNRMRRHVPPPDGEIARMTIDIFK